MFMKTILKFIAVISMAVLAGCASTTPVAVAPVGPNPNGLPVNSDQGGLQVFSRLTSVSDDGNQGSKEPGPAWYQHTAYLIFGADGSLVRNVQNQRGHYDQDPTLVMLPPGEYRVKAESVDYFWVDVPVTVQRGKVTRLHLDGRWSPPAGTSSAEVIRMPNGRAVGWKT